MMRPLFGPLFNHVEITYESSDMDPLFKTLTEDESLHVAYRDGDLHLYVTDITKPRTAEAQNGTGNVLALSILNAKITHLGEGRIRFEGFAVSDDHTQPYRRAYVTLRNATQKDPS